MNELEELTRPLTRQEVEASIYASLAAKGLDTTTWKPGAVVRAIVTAVSIVAAALSALTALIAKNGFLELSEAPWLSLHARYVYGVERLEGAFATAEVTLDNTGAGIFHLDPDDLVFSTSTGSTRTYRNVEPVSIAAGQTGVVVPVRAVEIGSGSTASAGDIDVLETTLLGVVVTGSTAALGTDAESDPALRTRCKEKIGTLSPNGPADAYRFVIKSARRPDGSPIGVTRAKHVADGRGNIDLYVANAGGSPYPPSDLDTLTAEVQQLAEPLGVHATVKNGAAVPVAVTCDLWVRDTSGMTDGEIEDRVKLALVEFGGTQPIGGVKLGAGIPGRLYADAIAAAIAGSLVPGTFLELDLNQPVGDVGLTIPEFAVLDPIVINVTQVAGEEP